MREIINLRHLENDGCDVWSHMPHEIGKLTSLGNEFFVRTFTDGVTWYL